MSDKHEDICDGYSFQFLDNVEQPVVQLGAVGVESRYSEEYYWDNRERPSSFLFQYTFNGSGLLETNHQTYILKSGDAFFLQRPGDDIYRFDEQRNHAPWEFVYILFSGYGVLPYYKYIVDRFGKVIHLSEYHPALKVLFELHEKAKNGLIQNAFTADSEVFRFLCLLCDIDTYTGEHQPSLVTKARAFLETNYNKQITLSQAAERLGVSQSHLSREFVKYVGEEPIRYLTKIRLEKAVELMISTDLNLQEISVYCGFANSNYFNKVFKKHMKTSPGQFRRQVREHGYISVKV